jgi:predicted Holliday junction resolvase-like endonuclease
MQPQQEQIKSDGLTHGMFRADICEIIHQFSEDSNFVGTCPECETKAPLGRWNLFYTDQYPAELKESVDEITSVPSELRKEYLELKAKATQLAAKKSLEVNVGKTIEEVVSVLPAFPYHRNDCRSLLDPIDYMGFDDLSKDGKVSKIHFVEVKTGASRLNDHQKQIKKAVENGKLEYRLF